MTAVFVLPAFQPRIEPAQGGRNGQLANAILQNRLHYAVNQAMAYRTKTWFRSTGYYAPTEPAASPQDRWWFYGHSGPYARRLRAIVVLGKDDNGGIHLSADSNATLKLYTSAGVQHGSTLEWHYGISGASASNSPDEWATFQSTIDVDADTDYYGIFSQVNYARIISAIVYEESLPPDTDNGYLPPITAGTNIYDAHSQAIDAALYALARRGAASWVTWSVDTTAISTTSSTAKNIVDNTSTAVSASTPGFYWDPTGKYRLTETSVPVRLAVYGKYTAGLAGKHGSVLIKDSGGSTVASIVDQWSSGAAAWVVNDVTLPTTAGKLDIQFSTSSGTFDLYAVSVYEYAV